MSNLTSWSEPLHEAGKPSGGQRLLRVITRLFLRVFTRITVLGVDNVPKDGPLLILANHASTIDAMLLLAFLPTPHISFVGPADFKLLFPANLLLKWYGMIPVKRATTMERSALRAMTNVLRRNGMLALFPEGGTWEKPLSEAKSGAAYISQATQAPILPVALGGTYRIWYEIVRLRRPRLTVHVGQLLPPTQSTTGKVERERALTESTLAVMSAIYERLPADDQRRYDARIGRQYKLNVERVDTAGKREYLTIPGADVLGEVMVKPNLVSPLVNNAGLPLESLLKYHGSPVPAASVRLAARMFATAIGADGRFAGYFEYRLGDSKARQLQQALHVLETTAIDQQNATFIFTPTSVGRK